MTQPRGLEFEYQRNRARIWLMLDNSKSVHEIMKFYGIEKESDVPKPLLHVETQTNTITFDYNNLLEEYKKNSSLIQIQCHL